MTISQTNWNKPGLFVNLFYETAPRCVWLGLELNSAGQWPFRTEIAQPWFIQTPLFLQRINPESSKYLKIFLIFFLCRIQFVTAAHKLPLPVLPATPAPPHDITMASANIKCKSHPWEPKNDSIPIMNENEGGLFWHPKSTQRRQLSTLTPHTATQIHCHIRQYTQTHP